LPLPPLLPPLPRGSHKEGYSLIQFWTDGSDKPIECGYGLGDYDQSEADKYGDEYKYASPSHGKYAKNTGKCYDVDQGKAPHWAKKGKGGGDKWCVGSGRVRAGC
jgi:hypothetical protein